MNKKNLTKICLTGVASAILVGGLASCSGEMKTAQKELNNKVVNVINNSDLKNNFKGEVEKFSFLSANFENASDQYFMNLHGLTKEKDSKQTSFTTLNYSVPSNVFDSVDTSKSENIVKVVSNIVDSQKAENIVTHRVNDVKKLNKAMKQVAQNTEDGYEISEMFLYGIGDITFDDARSAVKFATKSASLYKKTTVTEEWEVIGYQYGMPKFGWVTHSNTEYKTLYTDQDVYVKLDKDMYEQAKQDETIIFDKFCEYVKSKDNDKYQVKVQNVTTEKGLSANSMESSLNY